MQCMYPFFSHAKKKNNIQIKMQIFPCRPEYTRNCCNCNSSYTASIIIIPLYNRTNKLLIIHDAFCIWPKAISACYTHHIDVLCICICMQCACSALHCVLYTVQYACILQIQYYINHESKSFYSNYKSRNIIINFLDFLTYNSIGGARQQRKL